MILYIARRLLQAILVLTVVAAVSFSLFTFVGDLVNQMVGQEATMEQREEIREKLGLNDPIAVQYGRWLFRAIQGDMGTSAYNSQKVTDAVLDTLPVTLSLTMGGLMIAIVIGVPAGVSP